MTHGRIWLMESGRSSYQPFADLDLDCSQATAAHLAQADLKEERLEMRDAS